MLAITCWMNMPSFYQNDLYQELAKRADLRVIYDHEMTAERQQLGWSAELGGYEFRFLEPSRKLRHAVSIARSETDRVHVISGFWAEPAFVAAAYALGWAGTPFAVYSECPDLTAPPGVPRRGARAVVGRTVARYAKALLAVSHLAGDYFARLGFTAENTYPFGYFRSSPAHHETKPGPDTLELLYIGQFVHRKGLDVLLSAVEPLFPMHPKLGMSLIGAGQQQEALEAELRRDSIRGRVVLEGMLPSERIHERLKRASALVLPSRWDGWGMVINEAFSAGVPVIASDHCGAADLILDGINGYKFESENAEELRRCISALLRADQAALRAAASKTGAALAVSDAAEYLLDCLQHMCGHHSVKPAPPWENTLAELRKTHGSDETVRRSAFTGHGESDLCRSRTP
jgi:glycosyltransferase involved in cell wall biosynthesis